MATIESFAKANRVMSDFDRLIHLQWAVFCVLSANVEGSFVELGCNAGKTAAYLGLLLDHFGQRDRKFHVYDSFEGLPRRSKHDDFLKAGQLAASPDQVISEFARRGLAPPSIHPGWFEQTLPQQLPEQIAFAYLDADFYESTKVALETVYPRLSRGALLVVDDYGDRIANPRAWDVFKGVKIACDEFIRGKAERFQVLCATNDLAFGLLQKM
ncbi:TylF/MycF/NovP-related O-methyltransferase [Bradyrhizobium sp. AUGA SZCCT0283]|uniref:TylF/MycF/NovP-related O-methyltransferase n=1 Tax=Bradyrhizobium sp. AUGA SZCCT0283 TaxID=2807671 RepID=UPI0020115C88|nr:TylF/MycF/NovP-related O-methyltransferase [Bradyrhizobium sp. AUGA SZCCT0283]